MAKRKKTGGRTRGTLNKVTVEAKEAAAQIVDDPVYRRGLVKRAKRGELPPGVEVMLWHYAKGKPVERHEVGKPGDFSQVSDADLKTQLADLLGRL